MSRRYYVSETGAEILAFPAFKRPVPVAPPPGKATQEPEPGPAGHKLVVADALGIRAVLTGPMGARRLEIFENGVLFARIDDDAKAMAMAEVVMAYEPEQRALIFVGVCIGGTTPTPPPEPAP